MRQRPFEVVLYHATFGARWIARMRTREAATQFAAHNGWQGVPDYRVYVVERGREAI